MTRRRKEIMTIATDLFAAAGFANVTVDQIGAAAAVTGPALYHHFDSKEALLGELLIGISEELLAGGREIARSGAADVVAGLIRFHAGFAVERRSLITVHFRDLIHAHPADQHRVRALQREYVEVWAEALRAQRPGLSEDRALAAAHATIGLINSTPFSSHLRPDEMLDLLVAMAMGAISGA